MFGRLLFTFVATCFGLVLVACNTSTTEPETESPALDRVSLNWSVAPDCREALSLLDFSAEIDSRVQGSKSVREQSAVWIPEYTKLRVDANDVLLTPAEVELYCGLHYFSRLHGYDIDESGNPIYFPDTEEPEYFKFVAYTSILPHMIDYFKAVVGRKPIDGIELAVLWSQKQVADETWPDLNEPAGINLLMEWSSEKRLDYVAQFINPVTGRFFGPLEDDGWKPGEFTVREGTPADTASIESGTAQGFEAFGESIPGGTVFTLYGEREGIIVSQWMELDIPEDSAMHPDNKGNQITYPSE